VIPVARCEYSCAFCTTHFAHEAAGASGIRYPPRPLIGEGGTFRAKLARNARRDRGRLLEHKRATLSAVIARLDRATQYSEESVIESKSHGVLDPRVRGDDGSLWGSTLLIIGLAESETRFQGDDGFLWSGALR
jgi:hypothetical protein